jgi:hypothetical protein
LAHFCLFLRVLRSSMDRNSIKKDIKVAAGARLANPHHYIYFIIDI